MNYSCIRGQHPAASRPLHHVSSLISTLCCLIPGVLQLSGDEEDGLLSDVGSWAQFSSAILLQANVPVVVLVFLRLISVVVVLLQCLQEVALIGYCGLTEAKKESLSPKVKRRAWEVKRIC